MTKLTHALAMLTAAGGAVVGGGAQAATLIGSYVSSTYSETFDLDSAAGVQSGDFTSFALTNDSAGNTSATFGDGTTGFKAYYGLGSDSSFVTGTVMDSFQPVFYSPGATFVPQAGTSYASDFLPINGVLSFSATPEPEAWALLIAGAAMAGGALRARRRRALAA